MDLGLYFVTCEVSDRGLGHLDTARAAVEGGATTVQFRDKRLSGEALLAAARPVREMCGEHDVDFVMNDDAAAALALDADGLHVGQDELEESVTWRSAEDRGTAPRFLGVSVTDTSQVAEAERLGADYLGVGPIHATPSKPDAAPPMGLDGLREVRRRTSLPIVAIGGIGPDEVGPVMRAGADGVCVISAIASADDMVVAARELRRTVDAHRGMVSSPCTEGW